MSDPQSDPALHDEMQPLSRQRQWQNKNRERKMCIYCGKERIAPESTSLGKKCLLRKRALNRAKTGSKPWKPGGPGRPPIR